MTEDGRTFVPVGEVRIEEDEIEAVVAVLRSGNLRQGRVCREFEDAFAQFVGARHAVAVSSGTAALHLAYLAVLEPGDHVLVPSFTFFATASMVVAAGATPDFCDVDSNTYTLSLDSMHDRLTAKTRAIAPVHLFGNPADVDAVLAFADKNRCRVIWDAAQAHGTRFEGKDVGSLPGVTCYSFYPSKNMTTGEGGMVTTDDADVADRIRILRSQGSNKKYVHTAIGFNQRLTDFQAALGLVQLQKLPGWLEKRRDNASVLLAAIADVPGMNPQQAQSRGLHSYHQFSVVIDRDRLGRSRDEVAARFRELGVETAVHYPRPLHRQPVFEKTIGIQELPISDALSANILSLPVHNHLSTQQLERVVEAIASLRERAPARESVAAQH
jgi:perosamine synthetase